MRASITSGQKKQYCRLVEDAAQFGLDLALEKVPLDMDGLQRLLEQGGELRSAVIKVIVSKTRELSVTNRFANEEVESSYGYLSGYTKPKGITEQVNRLRELFPGVGFADETLAERPLTTGAEGPFAIPRWERIAPTYGEAVERVFALLEKTCDGKLVKHREGKFGTRYLRETPHAAKMWQKIGAEQKGNNILVVQAQFGINHRGRSVRRARAIMPVYEFGLGAFAIGIVLLTHPQRLRRHDDLWIDCAGDEYNLEADGDFSGVPYFAFVGDQLEFGVGCVGNPDEHSGSASAFLPQAA